MFRQGLINWRILILRLEIRGEKVPLTPHAYARSFCVPLHANSAVELDFLNQLKVAQDRVEQNVPGGRVLFPSVSCENEHLRKGSGRACRTELSLCGETVQTRVLFLNPATCCGI